MASSCRHGRWPLYEISDARIAVGSNDGLRVVRRPTPQSRFSVGLSKRAFKRLAKVDLRAAEGGDPMVTGGRSAAFIRVGPTEWLGWNVSLKLAFTPDRLSPSIVQARLY